VGCTEKGVVWTLGTFETVPIHLVTPPDTYPPIYSRIGGAKVGAAALVGMAAGAVATGALIASKQLPNEAPIPVAADQPETKKPGSKTPSGD
jgi:hypothetical protein